MSASVPRDKIGTPCVKCSRLLVPPNAFITREGRVLCKCRAREARVKWLARKLATGTLRRGATGRTDAEMLQALRQIARERGIEEDPS